MNNWLAAGLLSLVLAPGAMSQEIEPVSTQDRTIISHFSGKPVPRFESLRYAKVHGRAGPSFDHQIEWLYERAGLPVKIVKESQEWRRVQDPDGDEVWIHARMLTSAATALVRGKVFLKRDPATNATETAELAPGVIVLLEGCEGAWCRVDAGGRRGWVEKLHLWGGDALEAGL